MIIDVYEKLLEKVLIDQDQTLYVFQGFPYELYKALERMGIEHLNDEPVEEYVDYSKLEDKETSKALLMKLMTSDSSSWLFYEEFIALSAVVSDFKIYSGKIVVVKNNIFDVFYPLPVNGKPEIMLKLYGSDSAKEHSAFKYYSDCKLIDDTLYYAYVNKHFPIDTGIVIEERNLYSGADIYESTQEGYEKVNLSTLVGLKKQLQAGELNHRRFFITEHTNTLFDEIKVLNELGSFLDVVFYAEGNEKRNMEVNEDYLAVLRKYWGEQADFRINEFYKEPEASTETIQISQGEIITNIINQCILAEKEKDFSDLIVTAPTGAGKSVLFQIPSIYLCEKYGKVTIVICPLVALMVDQVKELTERGVNYATFINSAITFEERRERLEGIKNGKYSIVYLSPELLLSSDIRSLVDKRKVGLIVVDEAHLVTSWGRDFRVDYWFLGEYLEKVRHGSYYSKEEKVNVPILCLTATAVFGGQDDVIGDLQNSLQLVCNSEQIYIGYVRRDNIVFDIRHPIKESKSDKEEKVRLTISELERNAKNKTKTIAYFPFKSSIDDTWNKLKNENYASFDQVVKYHSGGEIGSIEKDQAYRDFRDNEKILMLATKAFGMGVNISDISEVYHFAPTGTLADYVQEIGRAARKLDKGFAITDYLPTDMHYARTLWGLSGLKHYQLQEMIKKVYEIYESKRRRNLLISPDTFNYLFDELSVENKVKSGLMLISSDMLEKYHFKVIAVRSKSLFSKQYITVPNEIEKAFMDKYGTYCTEMTDVTPRKESNKDGYESYTYKTGKIYEMNLADLWEKDFSEMTYPRFKRLFFTGELFDYGDHNIVANSRLIIRYSKDYDELKVVFKDITNAIQNTFNKIKRQFGGRNFSLKDFSDIFISYYQRPIRKEHINILLDLFCYDHIDLFEFPRESWKFIERRRPDEGSIVGSMYCIRTQKYSSIGTNLRKYFNLAEPNTAKNTYTTYVAIATSSGRLSGGAHLQLLASMLQLFDMASYEMNGGKNPEIFVRINDPQKLRRIAYSDRKYSNRILAEIELRHKRAVHIMNSFMQGDYTNAERWQIIEEYFLGHDETVEAMLSSENGNTLSSEHKDDKKRKKAQISLAEGEIFTEYYSNWEEASLIDDVDGYVRHGIPIPDYINAKVEINGENFDVRYVWEDMKVMIMEEKLQPGKLTQLETQKWLVYDVSGIDYASIGERLGGETDLWQK